MWRAVFLLPALLTGGCCAEEIDNGGAAEKDIVDELYEIKIQMDDLADHLRDDEHHEVIQLSGKEIEEKLTKIIDEIERNPPRFKSPRRDGQAARCRGDTPRKLSEKPPPIPGSIIVRKVGSIPQDKNSNWWKLGGSSYRESIQSWSGEIPLRWKARISAYFISVAAEEVKRTGK